MGEKVLRGHVELIYETLQTERRAEGKNVGVFSPPCLPHPLVELTDLKN